ncbi:MAG: MMPL family transporter, partial [Gammaproteobacteria bacterium]
VNRSMHGDDPAYYRLPDNAGELAQYLLLFEMSLPPGQDLNEQIRVDRQASKLSVVVRNGSSIELLDFDRRAQGWLKANAPAAMQVQGTSASIMFSRIGELNVEGMMEGYVLQLLLISGVVMLVLRSVKMGLLSLVPNVIPALLAFGAWGLFVGEIGLSVSVVAVMTYGIIVDDTIHTVFKYHHARTDLRLAIGDAVQYVYAHAGHSIFSTTLILVGGFGVLAFSNFQLNRDMGVMAATTIALAAMVDFVLVPALLSFGIRRPGAPLATPVPAPKATA